MFLKQRLGEDMKQALRQKDKLRLSTIRMICAQITNREKEKGSELSDEDILGVLSKAVKMREEAIELYRRGERDDLVAKEQAELEVIRSYMPEQLTEPEILAAITETIEEVQAEGMKDMGKVMGKLMPGLKGRADGKVVSRLVREKLAQMG